MCLHHIKVIVNICTDFVFVCSEERFHIYGGNDGASQNYISLCLEVTTILLCTCNLFLYICCTNQSSYLLLQLCRAVTQKIIGISD